ncbi:MAG: LysR family transcriptional regulator [Pseudomonadota bacterium]
MHGYLRHLANFAEVTRAGSITGAAGRLGVSPSVVSNSIRILETHYAEPLLERRRDGVRLTTKGSRVAEEAGTILDALHRAVGKPSREDATGEVRLALPRETVRGWFNAAFAALRTDHPEIQLALFPDDTLEDHTRYARDLYLRISPEEAYRDLHTLWTLPTEAALVAHPDLLDGKDPNDADAVTRLPDLSPKPIFAKSQSSLVAHSATGRIALAREGFGMTICLLHSVRHDLRRGTLVRCLPDQVNRKLHIVLGAPHKRPARRVAVVAEALEQAVRAD